MKKIRVSSGFTISKSKAPDGSFPLLYIQFRSGRIGTTKTIIEGKLFTDVDAVGRVLGIEVIAPVAQKDVLDCAPAGIRRKLSEFLANKPYSTTVLPPASVNLSQLIGRKAKAKSPKKKREPRAPIGPLSAKPKKAKSNRRKNVVETA